MFSYFEINFFLLNAVAICYLVHDVDAIHDLY